MRIESTDIDRICDALLDYRYVRFRTKAGLFIFSLNAGEGARTLISGGIIVDDNRRMDVVEMIADIKNLLTHGAAAVWNE